MECVECCDLFETIESKLATVINPAICGRIIQCTWLELTEWGKPLAPRGVSDLLLISTWIELSLVDVAPLSGGRFPLMLWSAAATPLAVW